MMDYGIYEKVEFNGIVPVNLIRHTRSGSEVVKSHWHPELELNIAFEGASRFFINGHVEDVTPNHMVLINSKEVHSSIPYFSTEGFAITGITLQISYAFLKSLVPNYDVCYFVVPDDVGQTIQEKIVKLNTLYLDPGTDYLNVLVMQHVCEIVYLLLTKCCKPRTGSGEQTTDETFRKLEKVLLFIHSNYNRPLLSGDVAEKFYFSKEYFCRYFKKCTGITFHQYLTNYRVIQAEKLLAKSDLKISQIAQETGFPDEGSFIQSFRRYYGCTPGKYRKEITQNPFFRKN